MPTSTSQFFVAVKDATSVPRNYLRDLRVAGLKHAVRALLIQLHEATVTGHIGGKNGSEAALNAFVGHLARSIQRVRDLRFY